MVPSLFLAHGSPMLAIEYSPYTEFLAGLGQRLKPEAIAIFTAHWESEVLAITDTDGEYETIYDFYGFPPELYRVRYPAKGSREIAEMLAKRFGEKGIEVRKDAERGLDHGTWTLLSRLFPDADIPVVQLSVHPFKEPREQIAIGEALRGLGLQNILVIGSGVTVHNLRMVHWGQEEPEPWAVEFDDWLIENIQNNDLDSLCRYMELAPHARNAVPRPEHFVPLFNAMGSGSGTKADVIYRDYEFGTLSYLCLQFE